MRKPQTIECLYLDFDGFFASVMQQVMPELRNRPVGVVPFDCHDRELFSTSVIACSKEAKKRGCKNVMPVPQAMELCPDMVLVPQRPDLYRKFHNTLVSEISCEIPIDAIKSIDELCCKLDKNDIKNPKALSERLKQRLKNNVGESITCSIGFAANRMLAKIACKQDKPNGVTIWHPQDMPAPLLPLPLSEIPGVGSRLQTRLNRANIFSMSDFLNTQPKQLRKLWGNVNGERMWYAAHGYDIYAMPTSRSIYGHGRVLPPEHRSLQQAAIYSRLLLTKAVRRLRRDGYYAKTLWLWLGMRHDKWSRQLSVPHANDDQTFLRALSQLLGQARQETRPNAEIIRLGVSITGLRKEGFIVDDMFNQPDQNMASWQKVSNEIDRLNSKFGKRVVTIGPWIEPPGGFAGGKISYTRIPSAEDFW